MSSAANRPVTVFRRRSLRRIAVSVSLGLVLLAVAAALVMVQGIDRQMRDVAHTYEVRNQAGELMIALSEAESSQRGFVLTSDDRYLAPFKLAVASLRDRTRALLAATQDDQQQAALVQGVTAKIVGKAAEMERTTTLVEAGHIDEALALIQTGLGVRLMDEVRETFDQFISEENQKLLDRNSRIGNTRLWLVGAVVLALAGAVLLAYSLLSRTWREVSALSLNTDRLASENEELEIHVQERTQALEEARTHAERERQRVETLLQDTNHRIGNSLATVSSLLGLQLLRSKSEPVKQALEAARSRVHAIASAHRRLRLGDDLETASAADFLDAVIEDIAATSAEAGSVTVMGDIEAIIVSARDATTLGILVGEIVTNSLKHAFPDGRKGQVTVALKRGVDGVPVLSVSDDGIGLAAGPISESGLGSVIVKQLARQFGGEPSYAPGAEGGLVVTINLPGIESSHQPSA